MAKRGLMIDRNARAPNHAELADPGVHVFVDDQNLFWGITNDTKFGRSFRIDFGLLLLEAAKGEDGRARPVRKAYIAGVIPDDDYFWEVAKNNGFEVKRGYLGSNNRSKQDDAYLITEIVSTLYESRGPSTIVLLAGDADYKPPLEKVIAKGWRSEIAFLGHSVSVSLEPVAHQFREIYPTAIQKYRDL
ncbi:MAG: NYN domain-containing protein [Rhizobiaceae bacterium]